MKKAFALIMAATISIMLYGCSTDQKLSDTSSSTVESGSVITTDDIKALEETAVYLNGYERVSTDSMEGKTIWVEGEIEGTNAIRSFIDGYVWSIDSSEIKAAKLKDKTVVKIFGKYELNGEKGTVIATAIIESPSFKDIIDKNKDDIKSRAINVSFNDLKDNFIDNYMKPIILTGDLREHVDYDFDYYLISEEGNVYKTVSMVGELDEISLPSCQVIMYGIFVGVSVGTPVFLPVDYEKIKSSKDADIPYPEFESKCEEANYESIMRSPTNYYNKLVHLKGTVKQDLDFGLYLVENSSGDFLVKGNQHGTNEKILEGDTVDVWGHSYFPTEKTTVLGVKKKFPQIFSIYLKNLKQ